MKKILILVSLSLFFLNGVELVSIASKPKIASTKIVKTNLIMTHKPQTVTATRNTSCPKSMNMEYKYSSSDAGHIRVKLTKILSSATSCSYTKRKNSSLPNGCIQGRVNGYERNMSSFFSDNSRPFYVKKPIVPLVSRRYWIVTATQIEVTPNSGQCTLDFHITLHKK